MIRAWGKCRVHGPTAKQTRVEAAGFSSISVFTSQWSSSAITHQCDTKGAGIFGRWTFIERVPALAVDKKAAMGIGSPAGGLLSVSLGSHGENCGSRSVAKDVCKWGVCKGVHILLAMHQLRFVTVVSRLRRIVGLAARKTRSASALWERYPPGLGFISIWDIKLDDAGHGVHLSADSLLTIVRPNQYRGPVRSRGRSDVNVLSVLRSIQAGSPQCSPLPFERRVFSACAFGCAMARKCPIFRAMRNTTCQTR
jgi:hypothetical protein